MFHVLSIKDMETGRKTMATLSVSEHRNRCFKVEAILYVYQHKWQGNQVLIFHQVIQ